jgi:hypothetical protein
VAYLFAGWQIYEHFAEERYGGMRYNHFIKDVLSDVRYVKRAAMKPIPSEGRLPFMVA